MDEATGRKSMLGAYGAWAARELGDGPGRLSLRSPGRRDLAAWRRDLPAMLTSQSLPGADRNFLPL